MAKDARLILEEQERPIPENTQRLGKCVYLREQVTGKVYKLHWQPAIVGRRTESQPRVDWVAVDLQPYPTGLRASRRHLMITEDHRQLQIENLAKNPATIFRNGDTRIPIEAEKVLLLPDDIISLERSQIVLKVITRDAQIEDSLDVPRDETPVS